MNEPNRRSNKYRCRLNGCDSRSSKWHSRSNKQTSRSNWQKSNSIRSEDF